MKLLRMRPGTGDFFAAAVATMHTLQVAAVGASPAGLSEANAPGGGRQTMEQRLNAAAKRENRLPPMPQAGLAAPATIGTRQQGYQLRDDPCLHSHQQQDRGGLDRQPQRRRRDTATQWRFTVTMPHSNLIRRQGGARDSWPWAKADIRT